jgi:hypothetical protein
MSAPTVKFAKPHVSGDRNQCAGCGALFNSSAAFDKHRTGDFGKDRRCMSATEMLAKKMATNAAGYWVTALNPKFAHPESA